MDVHSLRKFIEVYTYDLCPFRHVHYASIKNVIKEELMAV